MAEEKSVLLELNIKVSDALKQMAEYNTRLEKIRQNEQRHRDAIKKLETAIKKKQKAGNEASEEELNALKNNNELIEKDLEECKANL